MDDRIERHAFVARAAVAEQANGRRPVLKHTHAAATAASI
jgi:hypothetical protein